MHLCAAIRLTDTARGKGSTTLTLNSLPFRGRLIAGAPYSSLAVQGNGSPAPDRRAVHHE
jgi:hypothetical protein